MNFQSRKGILKIKLGYNANSSSVTSALSSFQWGRALATTLVFIVLLLLLVMKNKMKWFSKDKIEKDENKE